MPENEELLQQPSESDPVEESTTLLEEKAPIDEKKLAAIMKALQTSFTSCGRCSLFLASATIKFDDLLIKSAAAEMINNWLILPWDKDMREIVNKCFGCRIDVEAYHFEGSCPECSRPYRYSDPSPDQNPQFSIKAR